MCRSDFQLIDGSFARALPLAFPTTPGHEVAGRIAALAPTCPRSAGLTEGDLVVVDHQLGRRAVPAVSRGQRAVLRAATRWPRFGPPGGYRRVLAGTSPPSHRCAGQPGQSPRCLAPLTDAGLTPYREMKNLRTLASSAQAGRSCVNGTGGHGSYAVRYATTAGRRRRPSMAPAGSGVCYAFYGGDYDERTLATRSTSAHRARPEPTRRPGPPAATHRPPCRECSGLGRRTAPVAGTVRRETRAAARHSGAPGLRITLGNAGGQRRPALGDAAV